MGTQMVICVQMFLYIHHAMPHHSHHDNHPRHYHNPVQNYGSSHESTAPKVTDDDANENDDEMQVDESDDDFLTYDGSDAEPDNRRKSNKKKHKDKKNNKEKKVKKHKKTNDCDSASAEHKSDECKSNSIECRECSCSECTSNSDRKNSCCPYICELCAGTQTPGLAFVAYPVPYQWPMPGPMPVPIPGPYPCNMGDGNCSGSTTQPQPQSTSATPVSTPPATEATVPAVLLSQRIVVTHSDKTEDKIEALKAVLQDLTLSRRPTKKYSLRESDLTEAETTDESSLESEIKTTTTREPEPTKKSLRSKHKKKKKKKALLTSTSTTTPAPTMTTTVSTTTTTTPAPTTTTTPAPTTTTTSLPTTTTTTSAPTTTSTPEATTITTPLTIPEAPSVPVKVYYRPPVPQYADRPSLYNSHVRISNSLRDRDNPPYTSDLGQKKYRTYQQLSRRPVKDRGFREYTIQRRDFGMPENYTDHNNPVKMIVIKDGKKYVITERPKRMFNLKPIRYVSEMEAKETDARRRYDTNEIRSIMTDSNSHARYGIVPLSDKLTSKLLLKLRTMKELGGKSLPVPQIRKMEDTY